MFYLAHYSQWQGENSYIQELTLDDVKTFARENYDELEYTLGLVDEDECE